MAFSQSESAPVELERPLEFPDPNHGMNQFGQFPDPFRIARRAVRRVGKRYAESVVKVWTEIFPFFTKSVSVASVTQGFASHAR